MDEHRADPDVASSLSSIKSILAIVNGLTLTNTVLVLISGGRYSHIIPLSGLRLVNVAFAVVLIGNITRFYHGNVRHLDSAYGSESAARSASGRHSEPRGGLGVDFFVIFLQSLLFAVISFYVLAHARYIALFMLLLTLDVLWVVYSQWTDGDEAVSPQRMWLLNNLIAVVLFVVLFFVCKPRALNIALVVLAATTIVDFSLNWRFYFPRGAGQWHPGKPANIFLSAPLTQYIVSPDGAAMETFKTHWTQFAATLRRSGHTVFSAHEREAWGAALDVPEAALRTDISHLVKSDLVIAYIGDPPSPGVQLELGYAIAARKRILVLVMRDHTMPYLLRGLAARPHADVVELDSLNSLTPMLAGRGLIDYAGDLRS